jgi:CheY-like chemotaxis protein
MSTILTIDDDPLIADMLRVKLSEFGHEVVAAYGAVEAVANAARHKPDIITLDYHMQDDDGIAIYRRLRENAGTARTPIIFITGGDPGAVLAQMPTDSRVTFIEKPIDMDRLARTVAELLGYPTPTPRPAPPPENEPPA